MAQTNPAMARKMSMESRKTCGEDRRCGSKPLSSEILLSELNHDTIGLASPLQLAANLEPFRRKWKQFAGTDFMHRKNGRTRSPDRSRRALQRHGQRLVQIFIASHHGLHGMNIVAARDEIRHETACLAHHQGARGNIPRIETGFPEAVIAASGNPGEIE